MPIPGEYHAHGKPPHAVICRHVPQQHRPRLWAARIHCPCKDATGARETHARRCAPEHAAWWARASCSFSRARSHLGAAEALERGKELIALLDQVGIVFAVHDHRVALALALHLDKVVIGLLLATRGAHGGRSVCAGARHRPGSARTARPQAHARAPRPTLRPAPARASARPGMHAPGGRATRRGSRSTGRRSS